MVRYCGRVSQPPPPQGPQPPYNPQNQQPQQVTPDSKGWSGAMIALMISTALVALLAGILIGTQFGGDSSSQKTVTQKESHTTTATGGTVTITNTETQTQTETTTATTTVTGPTS